MHIISNPIINDPILWNFVNKKKLRFMIFFISVPYIKSYVAINHQVITVILKISPFSLLGNTSSLLPWSSDATPLHHPNESSKRSLQSLHNLRLTCLLLDGEFVDLCYKRLSSSLSMNMALRAWPQHSLIAMANQRIIWTSRVEYEQEHEKKEEKEGMWVENRMRNF